MRDIIDREDIEDMDHASSQHWPRVSPQNSMDLILIKMRWPLDEKVGTDLDLRVPPELCPMLQLLDNIEEEYREVARSMPVTDVARGEQGSKMQYLIEWHNNIYEIIRPGISCWVPEDIPETIATWYDTNWKTWCCPAENVETATAASTAAAASAETIDSQPP